jgi:hypothetical protein
MMTIATMGRRMGKGSAMTRYPDALAGGWPGWGLRAASGPCRLGLHDYAFLHLCKPSSMMCRRASPFQDQEFPANLIANLTGGCVVLLSGPTTHTKFLPCNSRLRAPAPGRSRGGCRSTTIRRTSRAKQLPGWETRHARAECGRRSTARSMKRIFPRGMHRGVGQDERDGQALTFLPVRRARSRPSEIPSPLTGNRTRWGRAEIVASKVGHPFLTSSPMTPLCPDAGWAPLPSQ